MLVNDGCKEGGASIMASEVRRSPHPVMQKEKEERNGAQNLPHTFMLAESACCMVSACCS